jgi:hypothetical protein
MVFSITGVSDVFAQENPIVDEFDVFESGGKVYLSCIISSGNTCNGIDVLRSIDSLNFDVVGHIGGICGNSLTPTPYNFIDKTPIKNRISYYKLEFGGYGFTKIISVHVIDTEEFGFQIRPNPANYKTTIYFENTENDEYQLSLYNMNGIEVLSQSTSTNQFELQIGNLLSGIYIFTISKDRYKQKKIGRLVVQH